MDIEKNHANNGSINIKGTGHKLKKKYKMNIARAACPDGNESLLAGMTLSLVIGRLLLVTAFNTAIKTMSSINPGIILHLTQS